MTYCSTASSSSAPAEVVGSYNVNLSTIVVVGSSVRDQRANERHF